MTSRRGAALTALVLSVGLGLSACTSDEPDPAPPPTSAPAPTKPVKMTFGVWGGEDELSAYRSVVEDFNAASTGSRFTVESFPDHDAFAQTLSAGSALPDVFLISRRDLAQITEQGLNRPLDDFLDERAVDVGDVYSRDALEAFAADRHLQCMPYGISPMVIYYNTDLIDFERMRERGLDAPTDGENSGWTFDQFTEAANVATRPRRGTRGLYVDPTLRGLAPFVYSGGGQIFDDDEEPTSLAFSEDDTRDALQRALELLRDPTVNLSAEQVAEKPALDWFKEGRLGMIEGFRNLVPELRRTPGLSFDVMPMPVLDSAATIGDITGVCISADAVDASEAADFLVSLTSTENVTKVARTGYLTPANQQVALSPDYLDPAQEPAHPQVFTDSVRSIVIPPLLIGGPELESAIAPGLSALLNVVNLDSETLDRITTQIDEASRTVLAPEETESPSPEDESTP